jgi:predicted DNA-binding protein (MmcQ/YjbR family)
MTPDAIFSRATFEAFVLALPAATLVRQWRDDSVAKVGGRIFCLLDQDDGEIWLKVSDLGFAMMTELPGVRPAPYFARAGWVAIAPTSPLSGDEIRAYIVDAHRLISGKLSRKLRAQLELC